MTNIISELQLTSRNMKTLSQMPEPRLCYGAEAFEDKVLILGVIHDDNARKTIDWVLAFHPKTKVCKEIPKLQGWK